MDALERTCALLHRAYSFPTFPDVRTRLVGMIGRGPYAGLFSLVSLVSSCWSLGATGPCRASGALIRNCGGE